MTLLFVPICVGGRHPGQMAVPKGLFEIVIWPKRLSECGPFAKSFGLSGDEKLKKMTG